MAKGYFTNAGFYGWVDSMNRYLLFASESDYYSYISEKGENQ